MLCYGTDIWCTLLTTTSLLLWLNLVVVVSVSVQFVPSQILDGCEAQHDKAIFSSCLVGSVQKRGYWLFVWLRLFSLASPASVISHAWHPFRARFICSASFSFARSKRVSPRIPALTVYLLLLRTPQIRPIFVKLNRPSLLFVCFWEVSSTISNNGML